MTNTQPVVLWDGPIGTEHYRVVDLGAVAAERLIVEIRLAPDAMGNRGWARIDQISRSVFQAMLVQSGVVT